MDNKKFIFGVIALLLLMIGGTYAYYKWSSTENINVNVKIEGGSVTFNGGSNITGVLIPTATKEGGIKKDITVKADTVGATMNLYMDLTTMPTELKEKYGKGFDFSSLYKYVKFHQEFPQILDSLRPKSGRPLSWTHYRILLQETAPEARAWYAKEAQEQAWSVRTLQRNISSQYYYRMLMSQNAEPVEKEMKELTASYQADKLEFIKNPVIAEFLGLSSNTDFTESELEQRIITHIQKFLMELGKGYAFVARQQLSLIHI